jgi:cytochrome c6
MRTILVFALIYWLFTPVSLADNLNSQQGKQIFNLNCAGCHPHGNNIIRRGKNLKLKTLQKNGYDTPEKIIWLITNGKNNMSAFKDRLSESEIQQVASYVLEQAQTNWR